MSDAINAACRALRSAAATFRDYAEHHRAKITEPGREFKALRNEQSAEECEKALADLRLMASGDERFK